MGVSGVDPSSPPPSVDVPDNIAQLDSFEAPLHIPALSDPTTPFHTVFIRAPACHSLNPPPDPLHPVEVLCTLPDELVPDEPPGDGQMGPARREDLGKVMIRQGRKMVTSFHPELSGDARVHQYWVETCVLGR